MDLYYCKDCGSVINAALLKRIETDIDVMIQLATCNDNGVVAGVTEIKIEGTSKSQQYSQTFVDLVHVGTLLTNNTLMRGRLGQIGNLWPTNRSYNKTGNYYKVVCKL